MVILLMRRAISDMIEEQFRFWEFRRFLLASVQRWQEEVLLFGDAESNGAVVAIKEMITNGDREPISTLQGVVGFAGGSGGLVRDVAMKEMIAAEAIEGALRTVQIREVRNGRLFFGLVGLWLVDECFTDGTLVKFKRLRIVRSKVVTLLAEQVLDGSSSLNDLLLCR